MRATARMLTLLGAASLAVAMLAACGAPRGPGGGAGSTTALTVPLGAVSASQGAFQYTIAKGFFARNALSVTTPLSAEGQLKSAIVAGSVSFDQLAGGDVMDLYAKGVGIKAVACTAPNTGYYIYAAKGTPSVRALVGKTVGVPSLGGAPQVAMQAYLVNNGLSPDATRFVALGSIPNVLTALTDGRIDSGLLSVPFNFRAKAAGLPELGYATGPPTPYIVNTAWAAGHPDEVTAILKSLVEGFWVYQTHRADALRVLARFLRLDPSDPTDRATLDRSFDSHLPPVQVPPGRCRAADFIPYVRYQPASQQAALRNLDPLFDNSYVDALDKQGFYTYVQHSYGPLPNGATLAQVLR